MTRFPALPFALLLASVLSATGRGLETQLTTEMPTFPVHVTNHHANAKDGMAWKWKGPQERRDYGEIFTAPQTFRADMLAIELLFSDQLRAKTQAAFVLQILHFPTGSLSQKPEILQTFEGNLPVNSTIPPDQSAWLGLKFSSVEFQQGQVYAFMLHFAAEGGAEQNLVLRVTPASTPEGGHGLARENEGPYQKAPSLNFLLGQEEAPHAALAPEHTPVTFLVDQRAATGYRTIASAVAQAKPGDTIQLAPGSGPYREILYIPQSGEPGRPITFDGSYETITGFEPLTFSKEGEHWTCDLHAFFAAAKNIQGFTKKDGDWTNTVIGALPTVLVYQGHRVFQDAATGQLTGYATLSEDRRKITLLPGVDPKGWEIASRDFALRVLNASHHLYRRVKLSGSLNDGANLHGTGTDLVFEQIACFQNLDEGFSAHDEISCSITDGTFFENDNGIGNIAHSVLVAKDIRVHDNSGWGLWFFNCSATISDALVYDNGVAQVVLHGNSQVILNNVSASKMAGSTKPWLSYEESANRTATIVFEKAATVQCQGTVAELPRENKIFAVLSQPSR